MAKGLFVGLMTLDLIYGVESLPQSNQKIVAQETAIAAGGPATNAAVGFAYFGNSASLLAVQGQHSLIPFLQTDLCDCGVTVVDLAPTRTESIPVSSIIVTQSTGERAVVCLNATQMQAKIEHIPPDILEDVQIVLIDGHQAAVSGNIAQLAHQQGIPVVLDGGSWKPHLVEILPWVDYAICSGDFYPPGCTTPESVVDYLKKAGVTQIAITNGADAIQYVTATNQGWLDVPKIKPVDTLGAGDIFHGAFCHYILQQEFAIALQSAARVASFACQSFGTRTWLALQPTAHF
jgi:sugar/nucleoside kinase (ribokinase family)